MKSIDYLLFVKKNNAKIKYIGIFLLFLSALITTRTYINYLAIQETILLTKKEIYHQKEQILFTENFLLNYYNSEYKEYFSYHKNKILYPGEKILKFENITQNKKDIPIKKYDNSQKKEDLSPKESWNTFIKEKLKNIH